MSHIIPILLDFDSSHVSERGHINHPWIPIVLWLLCMHTLPCIRVMMEVTGSFSDNSCFLTSLTQILSVINAAPFWWCHFSWAVSPILGLMSPSPIHIPFSGLHTQKSLFFVCGGSSSCQLPPWLISMLPDTTLTPVNILLAAPTDIHIDEPLSLPGNSQARNYLSHSQNNMQSSQEWIDLWLF